jgi:hypothetical protein
MLRGPAHEYITAFDAVAASASDMHEAVRTSTAMHESTTILRGFTASQFSGVRLGALSCACENFRKLAIRCLPSCALPFDPSISGQGRRN